MRRGRCRLRPPGQQFVQHYDERYQTHPSSSAASAYSIVYQWADAATRARSLDSERIIEALEGHRYSLLKDDAVLRLDEPGPLWWRLASVRANGDEVQVGDKVYAGVMADDFIKNMRDITQMERAVRAAESMTPQEKRDKLDELRKLKIVLAESTRRAAGQIVRPSDLP
mgnify:CR=1 FL=1